MEKIFNSVTGLAIACACKGYKFIACMSKGNSIERARMMKALGAEIILVDQMPDSPRGQVSGKDLALVEIRAREIAKERNTFRADQFNLVACNNAHELYTAEEMWFQTDGAIDAFVDFVGSGSTLEFLRGSPLVPMCVRLLSCLLGQKREKILCDTE